MKMLTKEKEIKVIIKEFNKCKTFEEQIRHLSNHSNILELYLDNDGEFIDFVEKELYELYSEIGNKNNQFNSMKIQDYIGNTEGAFKLLEILGVNVHYV
jgi:hypothetical protein